MINNKKYLMHLLLKGWLYICGILVIAVSIFLFVYIFYKGAQVMSLDFIFENPKGVPAGTEGGIFSALIGSIYLGSLAGLLGGTVSIFASIYLVFYCKSLIIKKVIKTSIFFLSGIPSILFGLIGYSVFIHMLQLPRSLLTACLTVAIMIIPFVTIRLVKILSEDSYKMMNASLCLGISRLYIVRKLILPNYFIEILTTITLSIAYGIGATAPVMYTGAVIYAEVPGNIMQPFMSLSYHLYILANDGISMEHAYGTAAVLMFLLLSINLTCRFIGKFREGARWSFGRK